MVLSNHSICTFSNYIPSQYMLSFHPSIAVVYILSLFQTVAFAFAFAPHTISQMLSSNSMFVGLTVTKPHIKLSVFILKSFFTTQPPWHLQLCNTHFYGQTLPFYIYLVKHTSEAISTSNTGTYYKSCFMLSK